MVSVEQERDLATFRSVLEVWPEAIRSNYEAIARHTGRPVMPVLKSDAYGLGLGLVYQALRDLAPPWVGVANPWEGVRLRRLGYRGRVLVLSGFLPEEVPLLAQWSLTPAVYDVSQLSWLWHGRTDRTPFAFHLKVDTGMGRLGVRWDRVDEFTQHLRRFPGLVLEGVFSNLACADRPEHALTPLQIERFQQVCRFLQDGGWPVVWRHLANSAAVHFWPDAWMDIVRPGLSLYGWLPPGSRLNLTMAVRWWARVLQVRLLPAGWTVGYGAQCRLDTDRWVAVVGVGYFDGYDRRFSPQAYMLSRRGERLPILGAISMDMTVVGVGSSASVRVGEPVLLLGEWQGQRIDLNDVAGWAQTAPHEVLSRLGPRVSRRLVRDIGGFWPLWDQLHA
jgi:alanine racemase